ncbi:hypothetical protein AB7M49_005929 [Bradyrhizobium elkanii]|nr:hypothetical protein [Bradyrhizobium elkanii]MCS4110224.1 hypothetical protein [Bradyrhizobium elkanii]
MPDDFSVDDRGRRGYVPGVIGNFLEAFRPIVAAAGVYGHNFIGEMGLNAVTVEFDLMNPARAAWHLLDRRRQRRRNEAGEERLGADLAIQRGEVFPVFSVGERSSARRQKRTAKWQGRRRPPLI